VATFHLHGIIEQGGVSWVSIRHGDYPAEGESAVKPDVARRGRFTTTCRLKPALRGACHAAHGWPAGQAIPSRLAQPEEVFFFEKKNQKTFVRLAPRKLTNYASGDEGGGAKVFWFFFSKNNTSLSRNPGARL
jgi:hypothetical protein